jgi:CubicO group peptidase (beta-lactamase class C family)
VSVLAAVDSWSANHVAVAVLGGDGALLGVHGDTSSEFALASVTKLLTAYAALVAVEEGTMGLDEPGGPPHATVRHLLAHASGLAPDALGPIAPPATKRIYSNSGFEILASLLERRSGIEFATYLQEAVLDPLRMASTRLAGSPAHGARSTVGDLSLFAQELLAPTLIADATMREATSVQCAGLSGVLPGFGRQDPNDWGLGFELKSTKHPHWTAPDGSPRTFGHFGRSGTFLWVDPDARLACVTLTDREFGSWAVQAWPAFSQSVLAADW